MAKVFVLVRLIDYSPTETLGVYSSFEKAASRADSTCLEKHVWREETKEGWRESQTRRHQTDWTYEESIAAIRDWGMRHTCADGLAIGAFDLDDEDGSDPDAPQGG